MSSGSLTNGCILKMTTASFSTATAWNAARSISAGRIGRRGAHARRDRWARTASTPTCRQSSGTPRARRPPFAITRGAEDGDHRRTHRGGDVHRRRIDADEELRPRRQRGQFLERKLAGEVDSRRWRRTADVCYGALVAAGTTSAISACSLASGAAAQHDGPTLRCQRIAQSRHACRGPALECPARCGMDMHESARPQAVLRQDLIDARLGGRARHHGHAFVCRRRLQPQRTQAVEIGVDGVTLRVRLRRVQMGEAVGPEAVAELGRHRPARAQQAHQPGAARMHRKMHDKIVVPRPQLPRSVAIRPRPAATAPAASSCGRSDATAPAPGGLRASARYRRRPAHRSRTAVPRASALKSPASPSSTSP